MKRFVFTRNAAIFLIVLIPIGYLAYNYASLPEIVPTHFGIDGKANGFGSKKNLWFIVILVSAISMGIYFLINNIYRIDPKKTAKLSGAAFKKIAIALMILLCASNILIVYSSIHRSLLVNKLLFPFLGLFFIYIGNLMHSIKPNYFVGIRVPWTLENEDNWRATHQFGGKLWFIGGIMITICTLLLPVEPGTIIFICGIGLLAIIPVIYSYVYFKNHKGLP